MLSVLLSVVGHVPTYSGCTQNCCKPPKHHSISQVIYLRGSGGLEIHVDSLTSPFDIAGGEIIDFDAVFRDEIDQSTYSLFVGCGGCVPGDAIVVAPSQLSDYETAQVEPFTRVPTMATFPLSRVTPVLCFAGKLSTAASSRRARSARSTRACSTRMSVRRNTLLLDSGITEIERTASPSCGERSSAWESSLHSWRSSSSPPM